MAGGRTRALNCQMRNTISLIGGEIGLGTCRPKNGDRVHPGSRKTLYYTNKSYLVDLIVREWVSGKALRPVNKAMLIPD